MEDFFWGGGEGQLNIPKPCHLITGPMRSPYAKYKSPTRSRILRKVFGGWVVDTTVNIVFCFGPGLRLGTEKT